MFLSIGLFTPWLDARGQEQSTPQRAPTAERSQLPEAWLGRWRKLETEAYRGKQDDIVFVNENVGWYVNGDGKIFKTIDGGATWIPVDMGNAVNKIRIVKGDGKRVGYAIGVQVHRIDWPDGQGK